MTTTERRTHLGDIEFRAAGEGTKIRAGGYAAKFDVLSQNLGGFVEQIRHGTFAKTVQEADIRALFNHDDNFLLGRNRAGTLRLEEDDVGLAYEVDLPDTTAGRDVATMLERGDLSGSSFSFRTISDEWGETESGFPLRTLTSVALLDVGPVVFPAYTDATSGLRSLAQARSLDPDAVIAAASEDRLAALLAADDTQSKKLTTDRAQPIVRHRFAHLAR